MAKKNKFHLGEALKDFEKLKRELPIIVGNEAKNFFLSSFRNGGFTDGSFQPWKPRKANSKRNKGRAILVDTGALRRSIKVTTATFNKIVIGSGLPYAAAHNDGVQKTVSVREHMRGRYKTSEYTHHTFLGNKKIKTKGKEMVSAAKFGKSSRKMNLPKRQFIGHSKTLNAQIIKKIGKQIKYVFK